MGIDLIAEPSSLLKEGWQELLGVGSPFFSGICLAGVSLFGRFLAGGLSSPVCALWGSLVVVLILLSCGGSVSEGHFWMNLPFLVLLGLSPQCYPNIHALWENSRAIKVG